MNQDERIKAVCRGKATYLIVAKTKRPDGIPPSLSMTTYSLFLPGLPECYSGLATGSMARDHSASSSLSPVRMRTACSKS